MGPLKDGQVRIGYSVLPQFQGAGFATEIVDGLIRNQRTSMLSV